MDIVVGHTYHKRLGGAKNAFRYGIDYILIDPHAPSPAKLFSRNKPNFASLYDIDYGGPNSDLRGPEWAKSALKDHGFDQTLKLQLLTQPKILGYAFNPVSFWLVQDAAGDLRAVLVEVNNTYKGRHSYLCAHPDHRPISPSDQLEAVKAFYVSPFQPIEGTYRFTFDISDKSINIRIEHRNSEGGVLTTLNGHRRPLTSWELIKSTLKRPIGGLRVISLIHYQALKLWLKKQLFRPAEPSPKHDITVSKEIGAQERT